jgi:hypothetical protein
MKMLDVVEGRILVKYTRNRQNQKVGVLVAIGRNEVGFSLANKRDRFDKQLGIRIAIQRAFTIPSPDINDIPRSIRSDYLEMLDRSVRYFK